jgi:hypothetical protein
MTVPSSNPPAGFYDQEGRQRWWDGVQWTDHYQSAPAAPTAQPPIQVNVTAPIQTDSRKAGDGAQYVRQQQGHSLVLWIILSLFLGIPVIWLIYYSASPNHYWHA